MTQLSTRANASTIDPTPSARVARDLALPTFVGVGVQRSGSTWLHECLAEHPQVFVPTMKELNFFGNRSTSELPEYAAHFVEGSGAPARGEITPTYVCDEAALEQIANALPGVRVFAVLREPVARAHSAYQLFREKRYVDRSFESVCTPDSDLVRNGLYADQLEALYRHFPRERVKVFLYDDVQRDPAGMLRELFAFIGVDASFQPPSLARRYNRIMFERTQQRLQRLRLGWAVEWVKASPFGDLIRWGHARLAGRSGSGIARDDRARIAGYFADDIERVEKLIGRDLSAWRSID